MRRNKLGHWVGYGMRPFRGNIIRTAHDALAKWTPDGTILGEETEAPARELYEYLWLWSNGYEEKEER